MAETQRRNRMDVSRIHDRQGMAHRRVVATGEIELEADGGLARVRLPRMAGEPRFEVWINPTEALQIAEACGWAVERRDG